MPVWLHLKPKWVGKGRERMKVNIAILFRSKKIAKKFKKIKKYHYGSISSHPRLKEDEKGGE